MHSIGEIWPTGPMPDRKDGAMRDVMRTPGSHHIESADSTGCKYFALWLACAWVLRSALQERNMVAVSRSDRLSWAGPRRRYGGATHFSHLNCSHEKRHPPPKKWWSSISLFSAEIALIVERLGSASQLLSRAKGNHGDGARVENGSHT